MMRMNVIWRTSAATVLVFTYLPLYVEYSVDRLAGRATTGARAGRRGVNDRPVTRLRNTT